MAIIRKDRETSENAIVNYRNVLGLLLTYKKPVQARAYYVHTNMNQVSLATNYVVILIMQNFLQGIIHLIFS